MTKFKVVMDGYSDWTVTADYVAYEGNCIIFYDEVPYNPKVIIRRDAHVTRVKDHD